MKDMKFVLLVLAISAFKNVKAQTQKPNIIFILADDLGFETLECNGGESYKTPYLNKMAQAGMRFTNAHATPLCTPSRIQHKVQEAVQSPGNNLLEGFVQVDEFFVGGPETGKTGRGNEKKQPRTYGVMAIEVDAFGIHSCYANVIPNAS